MQHRLARSCRALVICCVQPVPLIVTHETKIQKFNVKLAKHLKTKSFLSLLFIFDLFKFYVLLLDNTEFAKAGTFDATLYVQSSGNGQA